MAQYLCIVQAGQPAAGLREELAEGLARIGREHLHDSVPATVDWTVVESGSMFTAAKPSHSSLIVRAVP